MRAAADSSYFALDLGSGDPNDLTPEFGEGEEGIKIAAPLRVPLRARLVIPITAAARFRDEVRNGLPPMLWQSLVAVVWDASRNVLHAAALGDPSPIPEAEGGDPASEEEKLPPLAEPPAEPVDPNERMFDGPDEPLPPQSGTATPLTGGYFTQYRSFNLCEALTLPPLPGVYHLFVTYGPHQSNTVRIELVESGKGR